MQSVRREVSYKKIRSDKAEENISLQQRNKSQLNTGRGEKNFSDLLVDLVCKEYPHSGEEASVLMSNVWCMIEAEIMKDLCKSPSRTDLKERIGIVSSLYNNAVKRLQEMKKPLLKYGAVADYYRKF